MSIFDGLAGVFTSALGQSVTVTPSGGASRTITAIFVARSTDELGIVQQQPAIHAATADVSDLSDGDLITVNSTDYHARVFRSDGQGMTTVALQNA